MKEYYTPGIISLSIPYPIFLHVIPVDETLRIGRLYLAATLSILIKIFHATRIHLPYEESTPWGRGDELISPGVTCSFLHTHHISYARLFVPRTILYLANTTLKRQVEQQNMLVRSKGVPGTASSGFEGAGAGMCALNSSLSRGDSFSYLYDSERPTLGKFNRWNI